MYLISMSNQCFASQMVCLFGKVYCFQNFHEWSGNTEPHIDIKAKKEAKDLVANHMKHRQCDCTIFFSFRSNRKKTFFHILCLLSEYTIVAIICPFPLFHFCPKCLKIALHTCKPDIVHFVQYNCIEINIFFFCLPFLCSPKIQPQVRYFQLNIYFGVYCRQKICHDIFQECSQVCSNILID